MFRKFMIAATATIALGAAALAPTAASAGWHGFHGFHGWRGGYGWRGNYGWGGGPYIGVYGSGDDCQCTVQRRVIMTRFGERWRWVRYCY